MQAAGVLMVNYALHYITIGSSWVEFGGGPR